MQARSKSNDNSQGDSGREGTTGRSSISRNNEQGIKQGQTTTGLVPDDAMENKREKGQTATKQ
jgi:hypothetical protein